MLPGLGPRVVGGTFCPLDGATNPLKLLRALHTALQRQGGRYLGNHEVTAIAASDGGYRVATADGPAFEAETVVIAAGLGNRRLAALVDLNVPVDPLWGQIIVTERCQPLFELPTLHLRQTEEGSFLLGVSQRDAGLDTATHAEVMRDMAWRNAAMFPFLENLRIVRTWSGLRVMTPDGFPIYDRSPSHPGVYVVTGHSGVTTAANHALLLARWIAEGELPDEIAALSSKRFDVQASAA
jgi:glycine/D-amino acid oxidase-like deaminating enzyme